MRGQMFQTVVHAMIVIGLVLVAGVVYVAETQEREAQRTWVVEVCFTEKCIAKVLNGLSPQAAAEAKLATYGQWTNVWYRK